MRVNILWSVSILNENILIIRKCFAVLAKSDVFNQSVIVLMTKNFQLSKAAT